MQTPNTIVNFMEQWTPIGIIGAGSTCDVILVQDKITFEKQVLKLFKSNIKTSISESEAQLLLNMNHPRILSASSYFPKVFIPLPEDEYPVGEEEQILPVLALEYCPNGDLLGLIESFKRLSESVARTYFLQLVDALEYLHEKEICHLDIKPDNILVDQHYNLKLADLGVAMEVPKDCLVKGKVGTVLYHSPEMHLNRPYDAYKADLFALGITLFTMVTGNMPFNSAVASDPIYNLIIEGKWEEFWNVHESLEGSNCLTLSKSFKNLIQGMLAFEVNKRLSLEQLKNHAWTQGVASSEEKIFALITSIINKPTCAEEVKSSQAPCVDEGILSAAC